LASNNITVLIWGETGTGKELVARALHQFSEREAQPFVAVNCMAIPEALLESELFGHERGAFTGAVNQRLGRFEQAHGGTLFLDEIGDLALFTQGKLLRALQNRVIQRVGGTADIPVDVRVIAATNRDLKRAVQEKLFREDLYFRLNQAVIALPPLRERDEDIPGLIQHFLQRFRAENQMSPLPISAAAVELLQRHSWPGNVRELESVVHRAVLLARGKMITTEIAQDALGETPPDMGSRTNRIKEHVAELLSEAEGHDLAAPYARLIKTCEREFFTQALERVQGNKSKLAARLGVSRRTVYQKLQEHGLNT
jgi:DNA-binding NtrC family response regulator